MSAPTPTIAVPSATPATAVFVQPDACDTVLPESRLAALDALGLVLLGGPGGKYGTDYAAEATPEEAAGGISCIWGFNDTDVSSVTVSVAPLSDATRESALEGFASQGLPEVIESDFATYNDAGRDTSPALVNVLRSDSWISVIQTIGGEEAYAEAVTIAGEAAAEVYAPAG